MRHFTIAAAALLLLSTIIFASVETFSKKPVQLAWFYKPPKDGNLDVVANNFSWFILTHSDEPVRDELKVKGASGPFLLYLRFDAINDPGSCMAEPRRNQVAYQKGDFCDISKNHPDWFLRDDKGKIIKSENYTLMDPGNPEWQKFWLTRARQLQRKFGWDGVFMDNVETGFAKRIQKGQPAKYPDAKSYLAAIDSFLSFIYTSYFQPNGYPLFGNLISLKKLQAWNNHLDNLDGGMMESFAVDWHDGYRDADSWNDQLQMAESAQARGKMVILVAQGERKDDQREQFAFASYLLVTRSRAAFRYSLANHYVEAWLYNNYELKIGKPLGFRYEKNGTWYRDFEHATVSVNPSRHTSQITMK